MHNYDSLVRNTTFALFTMIIALLSVSTLGAVFETPLLVIFWYLALIGIALMILMSLLLAIAYGIRSMILRYRHLMIHWGGEAVGL